jgi:hypothetical protein
MQELIKLKPRCSWLTRKKFFLIKKFKKEKFFIKNVIIAIILIILVNVAGCYLIESSVEKCKKFANGDIDKLHKCLNI